MNRAFSLVELSIVLVILGLLTGGVLAGKSLIRAAEIRNVIKFQTTMATSVYTFRDKYFAIPGDMTNASSFWPTAGNGDGDGYINWSSERNYVPDHLYRAGLVNVTLLSNAIYGTSPYYNTPGEPSGVISYVGAASGYADLYANSPPRGSLVKGVGLQTGTVVLGTFINGPAMVAEEAWGIDTKLDDGLSNSGKFFAMDGRNADNTGYENCLTLSGSTYVYNLSNSVVACRFMYLLTGG